MPGGLCNWPQHYLYRGACADKTWQDPSCAGEYCVGGMSSISLFSVSFYFLALDSSREWAKRERCHCFVSWTDDCHDK